MKAKNIRTYYGIFLSVFTCVIGALFIVQAVRILADGGWVQGAYTRDVVLEMLFPVSIPFYIWIVAIVAGFVLSAVYPYNPRRANRAPERVTLNHLKKRIPQGHGKAYAHDLNCIRNEKLSRIVVDATCAFACLACAVAICVYVVNPSNFNKGSISQDMLDMLVNVAPALVIAFGCCIMQTLYSKYSMQGEITVLKRLITSHRGNPVIKYEESRANVLWNKVKAFFSSKQFIWSVRGVIGACAVVFLVLGIVSEGFRDVLIKAINICTECIGLG